VHALKWPRVPGSALVLLAAVGIVALDILVASPWTGLPVVLVMLIVTLAVAEQVRQIVASRGGAAGLAGCCGQRGRGHVSAAVFLGRVGPFTIALAIGDRPGRQRYRLAREGLPVG